MVSIFYLVLLILGYFMMAVLAVIPKTHTFRIALWPTVVLLAVHSVASLDMSIEDRDQSFMNAVFIFVMILIVTRSLDWTMAKEPLVRHANQEKSSLRSTITDAIDLAITLRGIGWDWAHGIPIPHETRPTDRRAFLFCVFRSAIIHVLLSGVTHVVIGSFSPTGIAANGGSIFDPTLPFYTRYLRASILSGCAVAGIYASVQSCYDACTLLGMLVFGQRPEQWPPAFDAPWRATSFASFWGRRWHQFFRRTFLVQGGFPLSYILGRTGYICGTFLSSALLHGGVMVLLNTDLEPWRLVTGFGMMAPVVLAEMAFERWTGRKVAGVAGWAWTLFWMTVWGNVIVDGFARAGVFGRLTFTERVVPGRDVLVDLVMGFDAWLHAI